MSNDQISANREKMELIDELPLSEVFRRLWESFIAIEKSKTPMMSPDECVTACKRIIPTLDWLHADGDKSSMTYDDYSTGELELFLLPCLMAYFEDKSPASDPSKRKDSLKRIVVLYRFYLASFQTLHMRLPDGNYLEEGEYEEDQQQKSAEYTRSKAIENFQWQKNLLAKIDDQSSFANDSDTARRQRAKDMLCYWVYRSRREIEIVQKEIKLLSSMPYRGDQSQSGASSVGASVPVFDLSFSNLRTVRDALRNQVFGLGYPSAPILTPEEWFADKQAKEALHRNADPQPLPQAKDPSEDTDSDEEEERRQTAIRMDDYKDTHRRGEGNTYRRG